MIRDVPPLSLQQVDIKFNDKGKLFDSPLFSVYRVRPAAMTPSKRPLKLGWLRSLGPAWMGLLPTRAFEIMLSATNAEVIRLLVLFTVRTQLSRGKLTNNLPFCVVLDVREKA